MYYNRHNSHIPSNNSYTCNTFLAVKISSWPDEELVYKEYNYKQVRKKIQRLKTYKGKMQFSGLLFTVMSAILLVSM